MVNTTLIVDGTGFLVAEEAATAQDWRRRSRPPLKNAISARSSAAISLFVALDVVRRYLCHGLTNNPIMPVTPFTCGDGGDPNFAVNSSRVRPGGNSFGAKSVAISVKV